MQCGESEILYSPCVSLSVIINVDLVCLCCQVSARWIFKIRVMCFHDCEVANGREVVDHARRSVGGLSVVLSLQ